jgi:hypothetical protein
MQLQHDLPHPPGTNNAVFHRKQFLAERIGWAAMALYVAWAIAGGFGDGWLSRNEATNATGTCAVEYQRFCRRDAPLELRVQFEPSEPQQQIAMHFNRKFIDGAKIERVVPAYQKMELDPDGVTLLFAIEPVKAEYSFMIEYKPQHVGTLSVAVRPAQEAEVAFKQFVYP